MDYVSLVGAISGVVAALYASMAYYRMAADDSPTLHIRFLEIVKNGTYHLVLEIHPGKRPTRYSVISVKEGRISPAKCVWEEGEPTTSPTQDLRPSYEVDIHVPSAIARDSGPDLSLILSMEKSAVISLYCGQSWFSKRIKTTVTASVAID